MHGTEIPWRESVLRGSICEVSSQRSLHACDFFQVLFAPLSGPISKLAAVAEEKRGKVSEKRLCWEKVELFHRKYVMLDGFARASEIMIGVLNLLKWAASFLVEPLQTMFNLAMSPFPGRKVLTEEKKRNF